MNCYDYEPLEEESFEARSSLMAVRSRIADPCTFRILVRNTADLLPDLGNRKLYDESYSTLEKVLRSISLLDAKLDMAREGDEAAAQKVPEVLDGTISEVKHLLACVKRAVAYGA